MELLVQAEGVELSSVRAAAERLGESLVVVGDGRQVRVHVHTEHPDAVLEAARGWGALCTLTIQDMDEEVARVGASGNRVAVIAVLADCGFAEILRGLGARVIYCDEGAGGDLLAQAAGESPGGGAIIVPTDSRTLALARAAASRRAGDTRVHVVATGTLPQAVAALIAVELDVAAAENARRMGEAAEPVRTIEVRRAPPPSEPAFLGWLDGEPEGGSANPEGVLESLLGRIGREAARLVTVYHRGGEDRGDEDRGDEDRGGEDRGGRLAELIGRRLPGVAIEIVVVPRMSAEFLVSVE